MPPVKWPPPWWKRALHAPHAYRQYRNSGVSRLLALRYVYFNLTH